MIKLIENFDHADVGFLDILGWQTNAFSVPITLLPAGRVGSNALKLAYGTCFMPPINRKCNIIAVGLCFGSLIVDDLTYNSPFRRWDVSSYNYTGPVFDIWFYYGAAHCNFHVQISINYLTKQGSVVCQTGIDGVGYPTITTAEKIPFPNLSSDYQFLEVYLDVTDFMNGTVKVAVNGHTYINKTGIATAAYTIFGSNPYDDRAKIDRVRFGINRASLLDCAYLLDDQGGYQDDFLGPVTVMPKYPIGYPSQRLDACGE
jgi:hypothetical protein